jgi:hypothetical protein
MSKHTPGPWVWDGNVCDYNIDQEAPWLVTSEYHKDQRLPSGVILGGQIQCHSEANARLIAAAPELLEALKDLLDHYTSLVNSGDAGNWDAETEGEVIATRAAIAKAEGETA